MTVYYATGGQPADDVSSGPEVSYDPELDLPVVELGLTYDAAQEEEALATPHYGAIPAWLVLVVGAFFAAKWAGERI